MKIIVTGSLGNVGLPLTKHLISNGHNVSVISHNKEKEKEIRALGASASIGSLEDATFLASAFRGADAVFAMVPTNFSVADPIAYYKIIAGNYVGALRDSGVRCVVHLSSYGAHLDKGTGFILGSYHAEQKLNELKDLTVTHLRPTYFYNNLYSFIGMIKGMGIMGSNYGGEDKILLTHPSDIASVATEELSRSPATSGIRYIVSDERSANDIALVIGAAIGRPDLQWLTFTDDQARAGLENAGIPSHIAEKFVEMGAATHSGILRGGFEMPSPSLMGKIKLANFANEFAKAFMSK